ncbi:hypothetical protein M011DRAFT_397034 [Sporormia fimetaria CBS 119925]|uniref:Protein BCP1 n=1 Tax=Sporormia fimetaria CBS 119925 TaxID=1340428 RepID=A0A6A6VKL5_9PLEO|nr:hypothetical protein M011DRAFT_397034 [Sporormia fimetaria CBS 119925]
MAKRKAKREAQQDEEMPDAPSEQTKRKNDDSDSDEDMDIVNVDFEWFGPDEIDFHGLKNLLRQLFDIDAQLFDLSALADLIIAQPGLGSTVKVDGKESDPFAFLTALNLSAHKDKPVIQQLAQYVARQASNQGGDIGRILPSLLEENSTAQVGLVLSERFINMPHQIVPPLYTMLQDEIQEAIKENEPYNFTHYLIMSKAYSEVESSLPTDDEPRSKKKRGGASEPETFYFHPEDEVLQKHAVGFTNFDYETPVDAGASDSKRAFQEAGIKPKGHMILIEGSKFAGAVENVQSYLGGSQ